MPVLITEPSIIPVPGGKRIEEYVGRANTGTEEVSVALMTGPPGWSEPAQTPSFREVTVVLEGAVLVEHDGQQIEVAAGQAIITEPGETVRYSVGPQGARYLAVCLPAFDESAAEREDA